MHDQRLQSIITQIENGQLPKAQDKEEQAYINLLLKLHAANSGQLTPDDQFINHLELKIMKGGRMSVQLSKFLKLPFIVGFAVVVLLLVGVSNSVNIPTPMDLLSGRMMKGYDYSDGGIGMGMGSSSAPISALSNGFDSGNYIAQEKMIAPEIMPYPNDYMADVITTDRSVVSSADLSITSKDVKSSLDEATTYVDSVNGYITSSSLNKMEDGYVAYLSFRIPSKNFQAAVQNFRRMGVEVVYENVNSYDQTNQVVSTDEQIQDLQDQLEEYQLLLKDAETPQEKLKYQQMVSNLERQIKSYQKQAQNLEAQEKMSTISLSISEDKFKIPFLEKLGFQLIIQDAVRTLAKLVMMIIVLAIWAVVLAPVWLPVLLVTKWLKRRNAKK